MFHNEMVHPICGDPECPIPDAHRAEPPPVTGEQLQQLVEEYERLDQIEAAARNAKGALVRSILFPKPIDFKLHRDAIRFICILASIGKVSKSICFCLV